MNKFPDPADFLQRFATKVLWHFTGYSKTETEAFSVLKEIIASQNLKISFHQPKIKMPGGDEREGYCSSCVCDIPFKDLRIHTMRYGRYGIAFKKENAIRMGHFNPVLYVQHDHHLFKRAEQLLPKIDQLAENSPELTEYLTIIGTYVKRGDFTRNVSPDTGLDLQQDNNFYYEREWRSAYDWKFQQNDVAAILLPQMQIEEMRIFINSSLPAKGFDQIPLISYELVECL